MHYQDTKKSKGTEAAPFEVGSAFGEVMTGNAGHQYPSSAHRPPAPVHL